jgi:hypothetical protein
MVPITLWISGVSVGGHCFDEDMSISELHPHAGVTGGPAVVVAEMAAGCGGWT